MKVPRVIDGLTRARAAAQSDGPTVPPLSPASIVHRLQRVALCSSNTQAHNALQSAVYMWLCPASSQARAL